MTKDDHIKTTPIDKLMPYIARVSIKHNKLFLACVGIVLIISAAVLLQFEVDTASFRYFKKDSIILKDINEIGENSAEYRDITL